MAIVCLRCKMWVIFLYIFTLSAVSSSSDFYLYNIENAERPSLVLQDELHRHRRDTNEHGDMQHPSLLTNETVSHLELSSIATNEKPAYHSADIPIQAPVLKPNSTSPANRNLGVNGTGQRVDKVKEVVSEAKVAEPSVQLNSDVTVNVTLPAVTSTTETPVLVMKEAVAVDAAKSKEEEDIAISHHTDDILNKTAQETNALKTEVDNHEYYKSTFTIDPTMGEKFWVNMSALPNVRTNELLSQSHRRAATVRLNFDFPFYGHVVRNVTIATGGFLYTGEYVHSWLAATQYIAPLMANFDTSLSNDSYIKYVDNGTAFTVQWEKVCLQDKPNGGEFTFQATLHNNGDIVFVYQHVPVYIESIQDDNHPVKVGLSDAYIIDRTIFFVRRKTIYEYHRVNFNREDIKNWTVIYLSALPTCLVNKDCRSCLSKPTSSFSCSWCPNSARCSNGMDRHRQDWLVQGCERKQLRNESQCSSQSESSAFDGSSHYDTEPGEGPVAGDGPQRGLVDDPEQASRVTNDVVAERRDKAVIGVSGVVSILFVLGLFGGLGMWLLYAYRNPHTASGQMLIRYRPSQWSWRRGEARYTAATIHM